MIVRRLARPLLAAVFVWGGVETLRNPEGRVKAATPFLEANVERVKGVLPARVPTDPATLVRLDAAVKVGAGVAFGLGRFPRLSAFLLAGSLVPTTLAGHAFWEQEDEAAKAAHRTHFMKNVGLLGGLLLATVDRPDNLGRKRRAAKQERKAAKHERRAAKVEKKAAMREIEHARRATKS